MKIMRFTDLGWGHAQNSGVSHLVRIIIKYYKCPMDSDKNSLVSCCISRQLARDADTGEPTESGGKRFHFLKLSKMIYGFLCFPRQENETLWDLNSLNLYRLPEEVLNYILSDGPHDYGNIGTSMNALHAVTSNLHRGSRAWCDLTTKEVNLIVKLSHIANRRAMKF